MTVISKYIQVMSKKIEVRVSDHEYDLISSNANGYKSLSDFIRQMAISPSKDENDLEALIGSKITSWGHLWDLLCKKAGSNDFIEVRDWLLSGRNPFEGYSYIGSRETEDDEGLSIEVLKFLDDRGREKEVKKEEAPLELLALIPKDDSKTSVWG